MPANYVAPGPISLASLYGRAAGAGGGGAGGGGGGYQGPPIQQLHDDTGRQQNQLAALGMQGQSQGDLAVLHGTIQGQLQRQAAELDAWQFGQKVTEQEAMRQRADQNAIAAIDADPTMSPAEKVQAKTRIKSRIDWVDERQKRDLQQAQVQMYQAHAAQYEAQADLDRRKRVWDARTMDGQGKIVVDDKDKPELARYMADAFPTLQPGAPEYQAEFERRAAETGVGRKYVTDPKTGGMIADPYELERLKHGLAASGGGSSGTGAPRGTGKGPQTEESAQRRSQDYFAAVAEAGKILGPGADPDKLLGLVNKILAGHGEHMGKYATSTPEGRRQAEAAQNRGKLVGIDTTAQQVQAMSLPPEIKGHALQLSGAIRGLLVRYPHDRPEAIQNRLNDLQRQWDALEASPGWQAALKSVPGGAAPPQPAAAPQPADEQSGAGHLFQRLRHGDLLNAVDLPPTFEEAAKRLKAGNLVTTDTLRQWYERK